MKVVILHKYTGEGRIDTVAVVSDTANIDGQFTEIDFEDTQGLIRTVPERQKELQDIFSGVLAMFGIRAVPPENSNAAESN